MKYLKMFFSYESAMQEAKRMYKAGYKVKLVKKWYGWILKDI